MSIESVKAYIERVETDEEFRAQVKAAADRETRMALVKAEGFDITAEAISAAKAELSEDRIDAITGSSSQVGAVTVTVGAAILAIAWIALAFLSTPVSYDHNYVTPTEQRAEMDGP